MVYAPELDRKEELTPNKLPWYEVTDEDWAGPDGVLTNIIHNS